MFTLLRLILGAGFLLHRRFNADPPARKAWRDLQGNITYIGETQPTPPGRLLGPGTQTSAELHFSVGTYRIDYQFGATTRIALLDTTEARTLLIKSGSGISYFTVEQTGNYRFLVEPDSESAAWRVYYRQIGGEGQSE